VSTATPAPPLSLSPAPSPPPPGAAPGLPTPPPLPGLLILLDPPSLRSILIPDERDFIDSARQEAAPSFEKRRPKLGRPAESGAKAVLRPRSFPNASTAPEAMQINPAERARAAAQVPRFMSKRFCYAGGGRRWQRGILTTDPIVSSQIEKSATARAVDLRDWDHSGGVCSAIGGG
jgi:hypothetical protein